MAIAAAAVGAIVAGAGAYASSKSSQDAAARGYRQRYQTQVKDLQKAGLNPMLSMNLPAPVPQVPPTHNLGEAVVKGASSAVAARQAKATIENIEADTSLKGSAQAVNIATARKASIDAGIAEAALPWAPSLAQATAQGADKNIALMQAQINKIAEETVGVKLNNEQLTKMQPILVEAQQLINKGMSAELVRKEVDAKWYEAMGATDKYGPVLNIILQMLERYTRVK